MGGEVCKRISSPRMTFLFDVYHVQVMEGDILTRIKQFHQYVGHYHVAGVPGRNEFDDNQELNYPPILRQLPPRATRAMSARNSFPPAIRCNHCAKRSRCVTSEPLSGQSDSSHTRGFY